MEGSQRTKVRVPRTGSVHAEGLLVGSVMIYVTIVWDREGN
jgi:hypothetical protein